MTFDLLAVTSPTGQVSLPAPRPVVGIHRYEWRGDTWSGPGWHGVPPEPGHTLVLDVGDADMLTEAGYATACRIAGHWPDVVVTGSGEAVASLVRCLTEYRAQGAT